MPNGGRPEKAIGVIVKDLTTVRTGLVEIRFPSGHQVYANIPAGQDASLGRSVEVLSSDTEPCWAFVRFVE